MVRYFPFRALGSYKNLFLVIWICVFMMGCSQNKNSKRILLKNSKIRAIADTLSADFVSQASSPNLSLISTPCAPRSGLTRIDEGSGLCTGNLKTTVSLEGVGINLIHNSVAAGLFWGVGFGFKLSIDQRLYLSGNTGFLLLGDGTKINLEFSSSNPRHWKAKDQRELRSKFFPLGPTPNQVTSVEEKTLDGVTLTYSRIGQSESYGLTEIRDRFLNSTRLTRSDDGLISEVLLFNGSKIELQYREGLLRTLTFVGNTLSTVSREYSFDYDSSNRLRLVLLPFQNTKWQIAYHQSTSLISRLDSPDGNFSTYTYLFGGILRSFQEPSGFLNLISYTNSFVMLTAPGIQTKETFSNGRIMTDNSNGIISTFTYDSSQGRMISFKNHFGQETKTAYFINSDNPFPEKITYPAPGNETVVYEYNRDFIPSKATYTDGTVTTEITFDPIQFGLPTLVKTNNRIRVQYRYDNGNLVTILGPTNVPVSSFSYENGKLVSQMDSEGLTTRYEYVEGTLMGIVDSFGRRTSFSRDGFGNLTGLTDPFNEISYPIDSQGFPTGSSLTRFLPTGKSVERQFIYELYSNGAPKTATETVRIGEQTVTTFNAGFSENHAGRLSTSTLQNVQGSAINLMGE